MDTHRGLFAMHITPRFPKLFFISPLLNLANCQQHDTASMPAPDATTLAFPLTAGLQDIMTAMIDPAADFLWESVGTTVSAGTVVEKQPATDAHDPSALLDVGDRLDEVCESCHLQFWYPGQYIPPITDSLFDHTTQ